MQKSQQLSLTAGEYDAFRQSLGHHSDAGVLFWESMLHVMLHRPMPTNDKIPSGMNAQTVAFVTKNGRAAWSTLLETSNALKVRKLKSINNIGIAVGVPEAFSTRGPSG